ncbi:MAG: bifunctional DNA-formamidopyrimidine glycosylase/DNA-(apurinic or apyrimidinic site) lyase [Methylobacillus sp.]|jgi:formamidopyrimidine-DNA glycosylase|nr:bifunctional DNA-formamidopyrimidine glycosylase/DNA-(apurinic or apyrimidinic site) lyase [Methylobacillus sp.]
MPELPEVETTLRGLERPLKDRIIAQVTVRNPALRWPVPKNLNALLCGQAVRRLSRRAKYLLIHFDHGTLIVHLGMSGCLCHLETFEPPGKHDHVDLQFDNGAVLRLRDPRRFGAVLWAQELESHPVIARLGIEPLDDAFNGAWLHRGLRSRTSAIKPTLMDGHLVVGVGNIYASESLFRARINPKLPAHKLSRSRCERLAQEIKATLNDAIRAGGSSLRDFFGVDGNPGYFQQEYYVYARAGEPCKVCSTEIKAIKQGQRSTFYCPRCQAR